LAPMLGLLFTATMSRSRRVRDADGTSYVVQRCDGSVSFRAISTFPHGVRLELGTAVAYYWTHRAGVTVEDNLQIVAGCTCIRSVDQRSSLGVPFPDEADHAARRHASTL